MPTRVKYRNTILIRHVARTFLVGLPTPQYIHDDDAQIEVLRTRVRFMHSLGSLGIKFAIFRPSELNSDGFKVFFCKKYYSKQFEYSWIKRMCIFHVLTVRGLSGSEGASMPCMGLPGNAEAPLVTRLLIT